MLTFMFFLFYFFLTTLKYHSI